MNEAIPTKADPERSEVFAGNFSDLVPWLSAEDRPNLIINDVTLRDGKQALPWWNLWHKEDGADFAKLLAEAGVHHVELGFPAVPEDPETQAVRHVVESTRGVSAMLFALARLVQSDIDTAMQTLKGAKYKGIHTFIGTSPQHIGSRRHDASGRERYTAVEYMRKIQESVRSAVRKITGNGFVCEFSPEDSTRSEKGFLMDTLGIAVENGATILNIPDTVGYSNPAEVSQLFGEIRRNFPDVILSTHAHNDGSMAEANSLAPVLDGSAHRVEGTVYGIGERAGNADWIAVAIYLLSRKENQEIAKNLLKNPHALAQITSYFEKMSGINGRLVQPFTGFESIINRSGIHQAEVRKMKSSYIWHNPDSFGFGERPMFDITPLSGKHGVQEALLKLGVEIDEATAIKMTGFYRGLFSPDVSAEDLIGGSQMDQKDIASLKSGIAKIRDEARNMKNTEANMQRWFSETNRLMLEAFFICNPDYRFGDYKLEEFSFGGFGSAGNGKTYTAKVKINGEEREAQAQGEVDAMIKVVQEAAHAENCVYYPGEVKPLSDRSDALAELRASMEDDLGNSVNLIVRDSSTVTAHLKAFVRGINMLAVQRRYKEKSVV